MLPDSFETHQTVCQASMEDLLKKQGFKIIKKPKAYSEIIYVNGKSHLVSVLVDFIVEKENKKYVVKVESGQVVDPTDPIVYRKLIEIRNIFPTYGILLLDMQNRELHEIKFEFPKPGIDILLSFIIVGLIIAAVIGMVFFYTQLKLF